MHTACTPHHTTFSACVDNADVLELRLLFPFYGGGTLAAALELQPAGFTEAVALADPTKPNPPEPRARARARARTQPLIRWRSPSSCSTLPPSRTATSGA